MEATFFQKILIAIVCGLVAAGGHEFYVDVIQGADKAMNEGYERRSKF